MERNGIGIVIHKAVSTAGTGICGIAACGIGGFRNLGSIGMVVVRAALPDLDVVDGTVIQSVGVGSDVGEQEILSTEPV